MRITTALVLATVSIAPIAIPAAQAENTIIRNLEDALGGRSNQSDRAYRSDQSGTSYRYDQSGRNDEGYNDRAVQNQQRSLDRQRDQLDQQQRRLNREHSRDRYDRDDRNDRYDQTYYR